MKSAIGFILALTTTSAAFAGTARMLYDVEQNLVERKMAQITGSNRAKLTFCSLTAQPFTITCDLSIQQSGDQGEPSEFKANVVFDVTEFKVGKVTKVSINSITEL